MDATAVEAREEIEARGPMISATRRPELPFLARWALVTGGIVFAGLAVTAFFVGQVGEILLLVSMLISALVLFGAWVLRG